MIDNDDGVSGPERWDFISMQDHSTLPTVAAARRRMVGSKSPRLLSVQ